MHTFAPFSLIRGATDNAALAVWLLGPTAPPDLVLALGRNVLARPVIKLLLRPPLIRRMRRP